MVTDTYLHRVISGYKIIDLLGCGGMGIVYRAVHLQSGKVVAVKILQQNSLEDRFINEAELHSGLKHPNIVEMYSLSMESDDGTANRIGFDIASSTFPSKVSANFSNILMKLDDRPVKFGFEIVNKTTGSVDIYDIIEEVKSQDGDGNDIWTLTRKKKTSDGTVTTQVVSAGTTYIDVQSNVDAIDSVLYLYVQCISIDTFKIEFGE